MVVSTGETIAAVVSHYDLAEIVGHTTAGTNGMPSHPPLPGGYRIRWTGARVLNHDGSRHYGVGIRPGHPVSLTIAAIREGRDEVLQRAVEVVGG